MSICAIFHIYPDIWCCATFLLDFLGNTQKKPFCNPIGARLACVNLQKILANKSEKQIENTIAKRWRKKIERNTIGMIVKLDGFRLIDAGTVCCVLCPRCSS
jgi:hypothetical protein